MKVIHIEVPDDVHRNAKTAAAKEGITLKQWVTAAMILMANTSKKETQ